MGWGERWGGADSHCLEISIALKPRMCSVTRPKRHASHSPLGAGADPWESAEATKMLCSSVADQRKRSESVYRKLVHLDALPPRPPMASVSVHLAVRHRRAARPRPVSVNNCAPNPDPNPHPAFPTGPRINLRSKWENRPPPPTQTKVRTSRMKVVKTLPTGLEPVGGSESPSRPAAAQGTSPARRGGSESTEGPLCPGPVSPAATGCTRPCTERARLTTARRVRGRQVCVQSPPSRVGRSPARPGLLGQRTRGAGWGQGSESLLRRDVVGTAGCRCVFQHHPLKRLTRPQRARGGSAHLWAAGVQPGRLLGALGAPNARSPDAR